MRVHIIRNDGVGGSNPSCGTSYLAHYRLWLRHLLGIYKKEPPKKSKFNVLAWPAITPKTLSDAVRTILCLQ
jgi:hypothetical protein